MRSAEPATSCYVFALARFWRTSFYIRRVKRSSANFARECAGHPYGLVQLREPSAA
jgi:hypothetical protein